MEEYIDGNDIYRSEGYSIGYQQALEDLGQEMKNDTYVKYRVKKRADRINLIRQLQIKKINETENEYRDRLRREKATIDYLVFLEN